MTKKLALVLSAFWLLITSSVYAATDATTAFSNLVANTQSSGPGYYTSAQRDTFVGGSYRVYIPQDNVALINIAPPTFSAGCGGVNIYFGGISYINSKQIEQLISQLPTMLYGLALAAIRTLCPICSDVLQAIQRMAQEASKAALDTCHLATLAMNAAVKSTGFGDNTTQQCNSWASIWGYDSDPISASTGTCSSMTNAVNAMNKNIDSLFSSNSDQGSQQAAQLCGSVGNREWCALTVSGMDNTYVKELMLSMMGAHVASSSCNTNSSGSSTSGECQFPGWSSLNALKGDRTADVAARELMDVILFGTNPSASAAAIQAAVGQANSAEFVAGTEQELQWAESQNLSNLPLYLCNASDGSSQYTAPASTPAKGGANGVPYLHFCDAITPVTLGSVSASQNPLITPTGLIVFVAQNLAAAANAIRQGQPVPQEALQLMQVIPLPVYKMVNIAAVYPDVASQLIKNYSVFIGYMVAQEVVSDWMTKTAPVSGLTADAPTIELSSDMAAVAAAVSASTKGIGQDVGNTLTLQLQILANIKQVNDAIYQTMAMNGIAGNLLFTQNLASGLVAGHS